MTNEIQPLTDNEIILSQVLNVRFQKALKEKYPSAEEIVGELTSPVIITKEDIDLFY